jgi:hypothetical protein
MQLLMARRDGDARMHGTILTTKMKLTTVLLRRGDDVAANGRSHTD